MLTKNTKLMAKAMFIGCNGYYPTLGGMIVGASIQCCEKCREDMIEFETGGMSLSTQDEKINMLEVAQYLELKLYSYNDYASSCNIEDFNDEYSIVCSECNDELMDKFYEDN